MAAIPRPVAKKVDSQPPPSGVKPIAAKPPQTPKPPVPMAKVAPKTPLPPRPAVATKSAPPAPLVGKAQAPRPLSVPPPKPEPVAAPTIPTAPVARDIVAPPPAFVTEPKPQRASHTEVDLPPYFERQPSFVLDDDESDPDLLRRFQTDVVERRKRLTRIAATVMGVAWMLCQIACARGIASSVVDAIGSDDAPAKTAVVAKDLKKH